MFRKSRDIEKEIVEYALNPANADRFAGLLKVILPAYTRWIWGQDSHYRRHFNAWQAAGFNLAPNHYYSPIPDVASLPPSYWRREFTLAGIDINETRQLELLAELQKYRPEYSRFAEAPPPGSGFHFHNGCFESCDAETLHGMVRLLRPRRVLEAGAGYSTLITAAACELNRTEDGTACEFAAIEPFPNDLFAKHIPGLTRLLRIPLQEAEPGLFTALEAGDILFIDSSHVLKAGSDVERIYLDIIPSLRPGVVVHVHDIFLPGPYPENWIRDEHIFWNEQQLLCAFLSFNAEFEVLWAGSWMAAKHRERLASAFPAFSADSVPGSFWFRRKPAGPR
jgi:hypothetical protein